MRAYDLVEETTTSIAGTGGNGAVTLTAISGRMRFSTAFGSGATIFRYVIEDVVTGAGEIGIGSVASNVLTRTKPQITWDGSSTKNDNAPSAYAFGSTPTSGNVRIRMAATAEERGIVLPGSNQTLSSDPWRDYPITATVGWDNGGFGAGMTANREYYTCYECPIGGRLQGIQFEITTSGAGNTKWALYPVNPADGLPGTKILDFNVVSVSSTGVKTDTTTGTWTPAGPIWLPPGWWYIGFISDVAPSIRSFASNVASSIRRRTPLSRSGGYGWANTCYASGLYSTGLPTNPTPTALESTTNVSVPWVGLKITP